MILLNEVGKERLLDKGDAEADEPRKKFREVRDESLDGLKVRFLSRILLLDEFLFRFIDCASRGHRLP